MVGADRLIMNQDLLQSSTLKILVIDDHQLILTGTFNTLQQQYPDAAIAKANTAVEAIAQIANSKSLFEKSNFILAVATSHDQRASHTDNRKIMSVSAIQFA
ncbi:response regulator transcription factor [Fortiea sp. LEGE XX443]|uniref:response regulator transcription factor n=1 Tax=Fortiea sp. LEGE XX443 TaxID=1828611 RepID=UPI00187DF86A|nr:response regulator transcription factor [Fortiea sp. LEGE XX443]MBE9005189.1 response regulator transcription factor [Fortiea sp. LEGE XX443]